MFRPLLKLVHRPVALRPFLGSCQPKRDISFWRKRDTDNPLQDNPPSQFSMRSFFLGYVIRKITHHDNHEDEDEDEQDYDQDITTWGEDSDDD